ncbi:B12-binding domain-containing radical SAM protein [bacterium]|nr:B12-binding domain-containing radical SAM protein [bacterium]
MTTKRSNKILLLAFYLEKAPGIRYLANYLLKNGFEPTICFVKTSPTNPSSISKKEKELLKELIEKNDFLFIGLSILSSYTLSEVIKVNNMIREHYNIPVVWGGVYPSLMPEDCAKYCDILIKGEGELALLELANTIRNGQDWKNIQNVCYYDENGNYHENKLRPLVENLDEIGYPLISDKHMYLIEGNKIFNEDPQLNSNFPQNWESYELTTTRGCPFGCSYCSSSKIREIYKGNGKFFRFRSVDNVIKELTEAIEKNPNIKEIRFWDEVFTTNKEWIEEFSKKYKEKIGLRFVTWGHPLLIEKETMEMLVDAGLRRIIVGFQSGSPHVRNEIFKRPESNEQIIEASKILSSFPELEVYYDLIICHILENISELKETFDLCMKLSAPFGLQIHGLSFLPKTDIIQTMINDGLYTEDELNNIFNAPFEENYRQWNGPRSDYYADNPEKEMWANLIYLTQYKSIRKKLINFIKSPKKNEKRIKELKRKMENLTYEEQENAKKGKTNNNIIKNIKLIFKIR